jgi:predicted RNA-binding Zn ribbon-like protein
LQDYFNSISDVIHWCRRLDIISQETERILLREMKRNPEKAEIYFKETIAFRELLYSVFQPLSTDKNVPSAVMDKYNALLSAYFPDLRIKQTTKGFIEDWALDENSFKRLLAFILNDSYETLLSNKLNRIKACGNCGWLFYDSTKNSKRRWCSMKSCGSSIKALEWYYRKKGIK